MNTEYGGPDVLRIVDIDRPVPCDDELLVEVHATTVNLTDCGFRAPSPSFVRLFAGLRRPRRTILGSEFAGVIAEVGSAVEDFSVGDEVFGVNATGSEPTPTTSASVSAPRSRTSRPAHRSKRQPPCATARSSP